LAFSGLRDDEPDLIAGRVRDHGVLLFEALPFIGFHIQPVFLTAAETDARRGSGNASREKVLRVVQEFFGLGSGCRVPGEFR
jgi:hypothetical protein